jgi:large subunit ribosomal protein L12
MKYVYAALLLHSSAQPVTEENVKKVVAASGSQVEEAQVKALVAALSEVNIDEALKSATAMAAAPVAAATPAEGKKEEKKAPEEEKKKEEEALAGLGALFG